MELNIELANTDRTKGTVNGGAYEVPDGYECVSTEERRRGAAALELLADLDRSRHGRHHGDIESEDPSGRSQGNPLLIAGTHIGYSLHGSSRIVVPPRNKLCDPSAWYVSPVPDRDSDATVLPADHKERLESDPEYRALSTSRSAFPRELHFPPIREG